MTTQTINRRKFKQGDYDRDCLPDGMTTDDVIPAEYNPYDDGDSPYHVMKDPDSDSNGFCPDWNYKDPEKLLGEHIDPDTGFTLDDEAPATIHRVEDEPLPYDEWSSCGDDENEDSPLPYDEEPIL